MAARTERGYMNTVITILVLVMAAIMFFMIGWSTMRYIQLKRYRRRKKQPLVLRTKEKVIVWVALAFAEREFTAFDPGQKQIMQELIKRITPTLDEDTVRDMQAAGSFAGIKDTAHSLAMAESYNDMMGQAICGDCGADLVFKTHPSQKFAALGCENSCTPYSSVMFATANMIVDPDSGLLGGVAKQLVTRSKKHPLKINVSDRKRDDTLKPASEGEPNVED